MSSSPITTSPGRSCRPRWPWSTRIDVDSVYPDPDLTGAGVAYRLASALVARHGITVPDLAAVAALGTIADMAPMTGESRVIVRLGLDELATTGHPGLQGLLRRAGADPGPSHRP